jgi:hypothetical protein
MLGNHGLSNHNWYDQPIQKEVNEMPGGDRTGPQGMGPMTGRAVGYCAGAGMPGYANALPGRGMGWVGGGGGRGRGNRWRHWYCATGLPGWARMGYAPPWTAGPLATPPPAEQEVAYLKEQAAYLQRQLEAVNQRLDELAPKE